MRVLFLHLLFISFLSLVSGSAVLAQTDLFAGTPSPTPVFLLDHSYDNSDVDGTSLKKKTDNDDFAPPEPANMDPAFKKDKDGKDSDSREPDVNGL
jgi:hypothetical protein